MISKLKKSVLIAICALLAALAALTAGIGFNAFSAKADGETTTIESFKMIDAQVRLPQDGDITTTKNAIRFRTVIDKTDLPEDDNVKVGTIIALTDSLVAADLNSKDSFNKGNLETKKVKYKIIEFGGEYLTKAVRENSYVYNACLCNIQDKNYAKSFSAISYITDNEGNITQYTDISTACIWDIAKKETESDTFTTDYESDEQAAINSLCATYNVDLGVASDDGENNIGIEVKHGLTLNDYQEEIATAIDKKGLRYYTGAITKDSAPADLTAIITENTSVLAGTINLEYTYISDGTYSNDYKNGYAVKINECTSATYANPVNITRTSLKIEVPETYNDGTSNGTKDVKIIAKNGFQYLNGVKDITFSIKVRYVGDSAFSASDFEYISLQGLTYNSVASNAFRNCTKLKVVIVGNGFTCHTQSFSTNAGTQNYVTLLCNGMEIANVGNTSKDGQNNEINPNGIYLYDGKGETCGTWGYSESGDIVIAEHNAHEFSENSNCSYCKAQSLNGINYLYDSDKNGYYVIGNDKYDSSVYGTYLTIPEKYNDGSHGELAVVGISSGAFNATAKGRYNGVTHIFADNVTCLEGSAFWRTTAQYISIRGVENVNQGNEFLACSNLTTLVVGKNFSSTTQQVFPKISDSNQKKIDIYIESDSYDWNKLVWKGILDGNIDFRNGQLSEKVYTYSNEEPTENSDTKWHFVENSEGYQIATLWSASTTTEE